MKLKLDEATALVLYRIIGATDLSKAGRKLINTDLARDEIAELFYQFEEKLIKRGHTDVNSTHYTYQE